MSEPIISVKNIGKKYKLGATLGGRNYKTLRDVLTQVAFNSFRKLSAAFRKEPPTGGNHSSINNPITQSPNNPITKSPNTSKEFWALKDISFDVKQGEVVGIIGRNGAGKTTLLKILSEITEPTEGEIRIQGRVASLLEVGTGFHPELSGRENIFMNGAILGMTNAVIKAKFDEIVAFAGVEKFIDTPVKRYSSGMYVRLAFAVAAHLETEILLVDEVLAVGDFDFQKKCLDKMGDVVKGGRTVLFVSHNMGAIRQLVSRCILLEEGSLTFDGDKEGCISKYLQSSFSETASRKAFPDRHPTKEFPIVIKGVALKAKDGRYKRDFSLGEPWCLEMELEAIKNNVEFQASLNIQNEIGVYVYHFVSRDTGRNSFFAGRSSKLGIILPKLLLYPGQYSVDLWLGFPGVISARRLDMIKSAISFSVDQSAGLEVTRPLGRGMALVHEVPIWGIDNV